jgi:hypothetical protein
MASFVATLLRRRIMEGIRYLHHRKKYLSPRELSCLGKKRDIAAILWLKGRETPKEDAMVVLGLNDGKEAKVPIYNLPDILGEETFALMKAEMPELVRKHAIVVRKRSATTRLLLLLWKHRGYTAKYDDGAVMSIYGSVRTKEEQTMTEHPSENNDNDEKS